MWARFISPSSRRRPFSSPALRERLEDRILFDGVPDAPVAPPDQPVDDPLAPAVEADASSHTAIAETAALDVADRTELVFVDKRVGNHQTLVAELLRDGAAEVYFLDRETDGLAQIEAALAGRSDIDALHIISHGEQGQLKLGSTLLTQDSMQGAYAERLAQIGAALGEQGDILVYGCNFAQGVTGAAAADTLARLTGADVAASIDDTGHANRNANWVLELQTGLVETGVVVSLSTQQEWRGILESDGDLTIELIAAPNFVVDSNMPESGPSAAYIGIRVTNTGSDTLTDVFVYAGDFAGGNVGLYPVLTNPTFGSQTYTGNLALSHAAGTADATRYLGDLAAGESRVQYFLVTYPRTDDAGNSLAGAKSDPLDDVVLPYDIWVTADDPIDGGLEAVANGEATLRSEISASANKIWPNTDSKVPNEYLDAFEQQLGWRPDATAITPGAQVQLQGIWYDMGRVIGGYDADGDLLPDYDVWMQPVGDASVFDASAFRLVKSYGVLIVKLNDGTEQVTAFEDQLYFKDLPANNTGVVGLVFYEFIATGGQSQAVLSPYQEAASGSGNEKYNGDYGTSGGTLVSTPPTVSFTKDAVNATTEAPLSSINKTGTLEYVLRATNTSTTTSLGLTQLGLPVVITDEVPDGTSYVLGSAAIDNSHADVRILYSTDDGLTWTTTEPTTQPVTNIQWWLLSSLDPGEVFEVTFQTTVAANFADAILANTGTVGLGVGSSLATDTEYTLIEGTATISGVVFNDNGAGGATPSDGVRGGTEGTLNNINVSLYVDMDGNGVVSAADILWGTATSTAGAYSFANLPDGDFLVEVQAFDPDRPTGYTLTTDGLAALTVAGASIANVNFGFGPVLDVDKELIGTSPILEGSLVSYTINVSNLLGDPWGESSGGFISYTAWAGAQHSTLTSTSVTNPANAFGSGPDGSFAQIEFSGNPRDTLGGGTFVVGSPTGNITSVKLLVWGYGQATHSNDTLKISAQTNTGALQQLGTLTAAQIQSATVPTLFEFDVTDSNPTLAGIQSWQWSDFTALATATGIQIETIKNSGPDRTFFFVDAFGFQIVTDQSVVGTGTAADTLVTVPLVDDYDQTALQFVSASITPTSVDTVNGILTWNNIGTLLPGQSETITVTFRALEPAGNSTQNNVSNTATSTGALLGDGSAANSDTDTVLVTLQPTAIIGDRVWLDHDNDQTQDAGEPGLSDVTVILRNSSGTELARTVTDSNGNYSFRVSSNATYTVVVDTATLPGTMSSTTTGGSSRSVTISSLANNTGIDFGYRFTQPVIYGNIWHDVDGDGDDSPAVTTPESGEGGLENITVTLYDTGRNRTNATVTTDAYGNYFIPVTINGSGPSATYSGSYEVRVTTTGMFATGSASQTVDPDATRDNKYAVTITAAEITAGNTLRGGYNFAYTNTGTFSLGDQVFYDWDGDGTFDAGQDEGIRNLTVELWEDEDGDGVIDVGVDARIGVTTTNPSGNYTFANLPLNDYIVRVDTADADYPVGAHAIYGDQRDLLLTGTSTSVDFAYLPVGSGSIAGTVWDDRNGDETQSGAQEVGLANVTVSLYADLNGDGTYTLVRSTTTDTDGGYSFDTLPAGLFRVVVDQTDADLLTSSGAQRVLTTVSGTINVTLTSAAASAGNNFGFAQLGSIGDSVFFDANRNGSFDDFEAGIGGVTVRLLDENGVVLATTVTSNGSDGNPVGYYQFSDLQPGEYQVQVVTATLPASAGSNTADPDRDGVPSWDNSYPTIDALYPADNKDEGILINYGVSYQGGDIGYEQTGIVGDRVWLDIDGDGVQDDGETGLENVRVTATNGVTTIQTDTNSDGQYILQGLTAGVWTVSVNTGTLPYSPLAATSSGSDSSFSVTINAAGAVTHIDGVSVTGQTDPQLAVDFGYRFNGANSISGTVVLEQRGTTNGLSGNPTDLPVEGITLFLFRSTGQLLGTTTTAADGTYSFTDLPADNGTYDYVVALSKNLPILANTVLTTTAALTPADTIVVIGNTVRQQLSITGSVTGLDFAFESTLDYDYGDLPATYSNTITDSPAGPRHILTVGSPYLGALAPDADADAIPSPTASSDAEDDGVTFVTPERWIDGTNGGSLQVTVNGNGWLLGWIDFDGDGSFSDANELIVDQAVTTGTYTINFDIPDGTIDGNAQNLFARFRLFAEEPLVPELAFTGTATGGEVEDYMIAVPQQAVTIGDATVVEGGNLIFNLNLAHASNAAITLNLATTNVTATGGSDYETGNFEYSTDGMTWLPATGTNGTVVTFAAGVTAIQVRINTTNDSDVESTETFTLSVASKSGPAGDTTDTGTGTIIDDDFTPTITVNDVTRNESDGTLTFTVSLDGASGNTVTVNYATAPGTAGSPGDFESTSGTLTFVSGETTKTVVVNLTGDNVVEATETFTLNLSGATNATIGDNSGLGTILDDDAAALTIDDVSHSEGNSGTTTYTFTVSLDRAVDTNVSVNWATADNTTNGTDLAVQSGTVTFSAGELSKTFSVTVSGDQTVELSESFFANLSGLSAGGRNVTLTDSQGVGTVTNDDAALVTIDDVSHSEGDSGTTTYTFTVALNRAVDTDVSLNWATADTTTNGTDLAPQSGSVTILAGETTATFSVSVSGDRTVEFDETFQVNLSGLSAGGRNVTLSDGQGLGTVVNDDAAPTTADSAVTVIEDATYTFEASDFAYSDGDSDPLASIRITSLPTDGVLRYNGVAITAGQIAAGFDVAAANIGLLTFAPSADENGSNYTTFGFTVSDGVNSSAAATMTVHVTAVNDAPSVAVPGNQTAAAGTGLVLSGISIGDIDAATGDVAVTLSIAGGTLTINYAVAGGLTAGDITGNGSGSVTLTGTVGEINATLAHATGVTYLYDTSGTRTLTVAVNDNGNTGVDPSTVGQPATGDGDDERASATFDITIPAPTLSIDNVTVVEGTDTHAVFTISLSNPTTMGIVMNLSLANVTATGGGTDYGAGGGTNLQVWNGSAWVNATTATIAAGTTSVQVRTPIIDDFISDHGETFTLGASVTSGTTSNGSASGTGTINDEAADAGDITYVSIAGPATVNEGATTTNYTVSLTQPAVTDVTVTLTYTGTAVDGNDFTGQATVTILAGTSSRTFTLPTSGDTLYEGDEPFTVTITATSGGGLERLLIDTANDDVTTTILDNDTPTLSIDDVTVTEGTDPHAVFTLSLSNESTENVVLTLSLTSGTATVGTDTGTSAALEYHNGTTWVTVPVSGQVTIAAGATTLQVRTAVADDALDEFTETYTLTAAHVSGTLTSTADVVGTGTILDDDPQPSLTIDDVTRSEDDGTLTFTVTLSGPSGKTVTVDYATAIGSALATNDFTMTSGQLTFAAGETTQTIVVALTNDNTVEAIETFTAGLSNASNATISDASGLGTITDDDAAVMTINDVSHVEGNAGTTTYTFTVTLDRQVDTPVTVNWAMAHDTTNGSDLDPQSGSITFGIGETSKTFDITVKTDTTVEANELFFVNLSGLNAGGRDVTIGDAQGLGTIIDDDGAQVSIDDVSRVEGNAGTTTYTFTVSLDQAVLTNMTVDWATAHVTTDGSDLASQFGTVTILAGATSATFDVTVQRDLRVELDETFRVNLTNLVTNGSAAVIGDDQGVGTIVNDDAAQLTIDNVSESEGDSGATTYTFTVSLDRLVDADVSVTWTTAVDSTDASDLAHQTGTVTILAGQSSQTFSVTVNGDDTVELDETFLVNLSNLSAGNRDVTIGDGQGQGTVVNDDSAFVSIDDVMLAEGDAATTAFTFTISLSQPADSSVRVDWSMADVDTNAADLPPHSGFVTFDPGETTKTVTILVSGDRLVEGDETFTVSLTGLTTSSAAISLGDDEGLGTILNDDNAPQTITNTLTTDEDTDLPLDADDFGYLDADGDPMVSVRITSLPTDGSLLFLGTAVTQTDIDNGLVIAVADLDELVFRPDPGEFGVFYASFSFVVSDGLNESAAAQMRFHVNSVNDPPTARDNDYITDEDQSVGGNLLTDNTGDGVDSDPDGGTLSVVDADGNGANGITPVSGPANGTLTLNSNGTFTYVPNGDFFGTDSFVYRITDGQGGFSEATVTIQVDPVNDDPIATNNTADVTEDGPLADSGNLLTDDDGDGVDSDIESNSLSVSVVTFGATSVATPAVGTTSLDGTYGTLTIARDGSYTYSLNNVHAAVQALDAGETLTETFGYGLSDGAGGSDVASLVVTIHGVNDAPVADSNSITVEEGSHNNPLGLAAPTDVDVESLTITITGLPDFGDVTLADGTLLSVNMTLTIGELTSLQYDVPAVYDGSPVSPLTYSVTDGTFTVTGSVTITVTRPTAVDDSDDVTAGDAFPATGTVLDNDSDPENDLLIVTQVSYGATTEPVPNDGSAVVIDGEYGTLTIYDDGSYSYALNNAHPDVVALNGAATLTETFGYVIADGHGGSDAAELDITIHGLNDAPTATDNTAGVSEDGPLIDVGNVLTDDDGDGVDSDPDSDPLTVREIAFGATTETVPAIGTVNISGQYGTLTIAADGSYTYTLNNTLAAVQQLQVGETLTEVFRYTATDSADDAVANLTITIDGRNDDPVGVGTIPNQSDADSDAITDLDVSGFFDDADVSDSLTFDALGTLPPGLSIHPTTGVITGTLTADASQGGVGGVYAVTIQVTDEYGRTATQTFNWTVTNPAPVATDNTGSVTEDGPIADSGNLLTDNDGPGLDSDPDGDALVVSAVDGVLVPGVGTVIINGLYGRLTIAADGGYTYTLNNTLPAVQSLRPGATLTETFTYTLSDGEGGADTAQLIVTIQGTNDSPLATDDANQTDARTPVSGTVLPNDSDPDGGQSLTVSAVNGVPGDVGQWIALSSGALLRLLPDGSYEYDPNGAFDHLGPLESADDRFTYTITDGAGGTATAEVVIRIDGVNTPPIAWGEIVYTPMNEPVTVPVLSNDTDPNGEPLALILIETPPMGTTTVNPDGSISYQPAVGYVGTVYIRYLAQDPHGASCPATLMIVVEGESAAPTLPFGFDSFNNFSRPRQIFGDDANAMYRPAMLTREIMTLAPEPTFSGYARPGTLIVGRIYDERGVLIGEAFAHTDPGGNWMMQFHGIARFEQHRIEFDYVTESRDIYGYLGLDPSDNSYQAMQPLTNGEQPLSVATALQRSPWESLNALHNELNRPLGFGD